MEQSGAAGPSVRAWFGSKQKSMRSFHFSPSTSSVTALIAMTCLMSGSEMPRMLPRMILQIHPRRKQRDQQQSEREVGGEHDPDGRVLADAALGLDEGHGARGQQPGDKAPARTAAREYRPPPPPEPPRATRRRPSATSP